MVKHYAIEIKVRNNYFLTKMREAGIETVAQLSRDSGIHVTEIYGFLSLKRVPKKQSGEWSHTIEKIALALRCLPEDLFPPQHIETPLKKNKATIEADAMDVAALTSSLRSDPLGAIERKQALKKIDEMLDDLTPRERKVLESRFGLVDGIERTLDETRHLIGGDIVTRTRIRQIEEKALRKLRYPHPPRLRKNYCSSLISSLNS